MSDPKGWTNGRTLAPLRKTQLAKGKVLVRRHLNGELHFCYDTRDLRYTLLPERPKPKPVIKQKTKKRGGGVSIIEQYVPPTNHVWRSFQFGKGPPWAR